MTRRLTAANGTSVEATGRVVIKATVDKEKVEIDGLVSDHVTKIIVGGLAAQQYGLVGPL